MLLKLSCIFFNCCFIFSPTQSLWFQFPLRSFFLVYFLVINSQRQQHLGQQPFQALHLCIKICPFSGYVVEGVAVAVAVADVAGDATATATRKLANERSDGKVCLSIT